VRLLSARSVRGMLMTPWFVAGAGILIAATLVLESPRDAVLSYGPPSPGVQCLTPGCAAIAPKRQHDSLAVVRPGVRLNAAGAKGAAAARALPRRSAHTGAVAVRFRLIQHGQRGFIAVIIVHRGKKLGDWTLGFTIPGASISAVLGARWLPDASADGGVAERQPADWSPPQSQSSPQSPPLTPKTARIVIFGTGTPGKPAACTFDHRSCVFT